MDSEADDTCPSLMESIQQIRSLLDTLKSQHSALLKAMQPTLPEIVTHSLSSTAEEEESAEYQTPQSLTPKTRRSLHESITTSFSDSPLEWFDATDVFDGPEEFVLEPVQDVPVSVGLLEADSQSDNSSIDTNIDDLDSLAAPAPEAVATSSSGGFNVVRRTQLPVPSFSDEGSLFTILKKNVGKVCVSYCHDHWLIEVTSQDLSTIAFPVTFNEPLTLLQRAAEEVEYHGLLDEAASSTDPVTRMSYVAAFAISSYAHTCHRSGRKGL